MKLNIGCGPFYKKGYINIDPFARKFTDGYFFSWLLPYDNESIEEVVSFQLLEHLGYVGSLFSVSEWYRILKNHGKILIETIDLEKTLETKPLDKNWLFGMDYEGMTHKYCFVAKEITNLLTKAGFSQIKFRKKSFSRKPILQIEGIKIQDLDKQIISRIRYKLLEKKIISLSKIRRTDAAYEKVLDDIEMILKKHTNNPSKISELLKITSSFTPKLSILLFELLIETYEPLKKYGKELKKAIEISHSLDKDRIVAFLSYLFYKTAKVTDMSKTVFERIKLIACQYIEGQFKETDKNQLLPLELAIFRDLKIPGLFKKISHFSLPELTSLSFEFEAKGVKLFSLEKYRQAKICFMKAVSFNSENHFSYWNLARLSLIEKNTPKALICYEKAWETIPEVFNEELEKEISDVARFDNFNNYLTVKENVYY